MWLIPPFAPPLGKALSCFASWKNKPFFFFNQVLLNLHTYYYTTNFLFWNSMISFYGAKILRWFISRCYLKVRPIQEKLRFSQHLKKRKRPK